METADPIPRAGHPAISIIVPVHNRETLIARTLESILAQTFPDYEAVVVDDGSVDGTAEVVQRFASRDPRIRYVWRPNGGPGAARNTGIEKSGGPWIAFLDSDDVWTPDKLANAMRLVAGNPAIDFVHTNWKALYPDGRESKPRDTAQFERFSDRRYLLRHFCLKTSTVLIARRLIDSLGGYFYTDRPLYEDYHLFWRAVIRARSIGYIETCDTIAFQSQRSIVRSSSAASNLEAKIFAMDRMRRWIAESGQDKTYCAIFDESKYRNIQNSLRETLNDRPVPELVRQFVFSCRSIGLIMSIRGLLSVALEPRTSR